MSSEHNQFVQLNNFTFLKMKKLFTFFIAALCSFATFAQLPAGSIAPNFTGKDINGVTHTLYDILDQGKAVIMDVSATWCVPCWNYHNSNALEELYSTHGPSGDDKVMVLFIEGEDSNNGACIYGPSGCVGPNGGTTGDWTAGTEYPIIDDWTIGSAFEIAYFPTIYLICRDRIVTEPGQLKADALWAKVEGCNPIVGTNNAKVIGFKHGAAETSICGATPAAPSIKISNIGSDNLKSASILLKWNGNTLQTINWTGDLKSFQFDDILFDQFEINEPGKMEVEISNVNGKADDDAANNKVTSVDFTKAPEFPTQRIFVKIKTDGFAEEFYWEFRDSDGNVLDHGGNETVNPSNGPYDKDDPSQYGDNLTIRDTLTMPVNGCYSMFVVDAYGDGMSNFTAATADDGYVKMYKLGNTITPIINIAGNGYETSLNSPFGGNTFTGVDDLIPAGDFDVFPNPTHGVLNVDFVLNRAADVQITVTNALGQNVKSELGKTFGAGFQQQVLQVNDLPSGIYLLNLRTEEGVISKKFTKN